MKFKSLEMLKELQYCNKTINSYIPQADPEAIVFIMNPL
jgi:hypothetical protein